MAGLPYNCRCFTVTGNVAPMPNPGAAGPGSANTPPTTDCNGNPFQLATPATVLQPKTNRTFFYARSYQQSWTAPAKCQVLIHATAGGGGGGDCAGLYSAHLYSPDCVINQSIAGTGSPGISGLPGISVLNQWFALNAGDTILINVGSGGAPGHISSLLPTPPSTNNAPLKGGDTIIAVPGKQPLFLAGGQAGANGSYPTVSAVNACGYGVLIKSISGAYQTIYNWPCAYAGSGVPYGLEWDVDSAGVGNDFCTVTGSSYYGPNGLTAAQSGCVVTTKTPTYSSSYGAGMMGTAFSIYASPNGSRFPSGGDGLVVLDYIPCIP